MGTHHHLLRVCAILVAVFCSMQTVSAQTDSLSRLSMHFQFTAINQYHPDFKSSYEGQNSLQPQSERAMSVTATAMLGLRLWDGASVYYNPEIAGGKGFSSALGVAGFTNGECFRIGDPSPTVYTARFYYHQNFALSAGDIKMADAANQVNESAPSKRIAITFGKLSLADILSNNLFAHNARTQFMNWSLMAPGAYDFCANTRGYTYIGAVEVIYPNWALRFVTSAVPKWANGPDLEYNAKNAASYNLEFEHQLKLFGRPGTFRVLAYMNLSNAGNYQEAINNYKNGSDLSLDVNSLDTHKGKKIGFVFSGDQELTDNLGFFLNAAYNDGKTASWAFTEIDRSLSFGLNLAGKLWHRKADNIGVGVSINGISKDHRDFLNAGGYGFIIGDGKLTNYGTENIFETYYQAKVHENIWISGGYQFITNPAYNRDRGSVNVFSLRCHLEF